VVLLPRGVRLSAGAADAPDVLRLGLVAPPGGTAEEIADELVDALPALLADRVTGSVRWSVSQVADRSADDPTLETTELIDAVRRRMVAERWDLALCLTDIPLRLGRRPVVANASAMHGVGLVSLPALGAVQLRRRVADAAVRLVDGLVGASLELERGAEDEHRRRVARRLGEIARPVRAVRADEDDDVDLRFVAAVVRGHLRLLAGMVRANRPWRVTVRLSRALAAAIAAVAFSLVTADIWKLADAQAPWRLLVIALASIVTIVVFLIAAHSLWERADTARAREQAVLFNVATVATLTFGVLCLYGALLVLTFAVAEFTLDAHVLARALGHPANLATYVKVTWFATSLAMVAGALGAGLESDEAVREAAYGYRRERRTERDRD
jgi:uncharacterized membrane protein